MKNNKRGKVTSVSFILMLVISTFAFAYMIGSETASVSAITAWEQAGYETYEEWLDADPGVATTTLDSELDGNDDYTYSPDFKTSPVATSPVSAMSTAAATPNIPVSGSTTVYDNGDGTSSFYNTDGVLVTINSDSETIIKTPTKAPSNFFSDSTKILSGEQAEKLIGIENYNKDKSYYQAASGAIYTKGPGNTAVWEGRGQVNAWGTTWDFGAGQLMQGLQWAGIAAGLTMTLGSLFIKDKAEVAAMTAGIAAGILVGKSMYALLGNGGSSLGGKTGFLLNSDTNKPLTTMSGNPNSAGTFGKVLSSPWTSGAIGAATAWLVYNAMWSKEKVTIETVTFNCLPWQAPQGGKDCELCNDATLPCSEYRCKSLGQSCEIVNKGTVEEMCVNVNARDSSPPVIKPLLSEITEGYQYFDIKEMPPGAGFKIGSKTSSDKCIPAYTPIKFAIETNEPSQCRVDIVPQGNYSKMAAFMGGSNLYSYNHSELLNLPSSADIKNSSITLKNGKELIFYIRCKDAAGNANEADYALTMCVDPSPDNTAPVIHGTSIANKGCVAAEAENATVEFYISEPAQCKWNYFDTDYEQMKNNMICSTDAVEINALQSYTCTTKLNGIARDGTNFFVRCKDQPESTVNESKRNKNEESYVFNLRGSNQLKLKVLRPNETIYGAVRPAPIELYTETLFGCEDNKAICYYSTTNSTNSFVQFFDTNKQDGIHTQRLDLLDGTYTYYVRCVDGGGNIASDSVTFTVSIDTNAPVIARVYEEDGYLKLVTPLNSECVYNSNNCDYLFSEGTQMPYANSTTHVTEWFPDKNYYIKCRDEYRSEPVDCSLVVRPTENFLGA